MFCGVFGGIFGGVWVCFGCMCVVFWEVLGGQHKGTI